MASKIGIASNALLLLGDSPISSFDEGGAGATATANLFESVYTDLLVSHPWRFARKKVALSKKTSGPLFGYKYSYSIPQDVLRIISLDSNMNYEVVGDEIQADDAAAQLFYIFRADEGDLPPYFEHLCEIKLASMVAMAVTDRNTLADALEVKAREQFLKAAGIDSQESTTVAIQDNPLIDVRW